MHRRLDEFTGTGGIAPVEGPPIGTKLTKKKKKKRSNKSAVAAIIGENEEDEEGLIPDDADELEVGSTYGGRHDTGDNIDSTQYSEPLMDPTVALVAPDCTPRAFEPVDRQVVPSAASHAQAAPQAMQQVAQQATQQPQDVTINALLGRGRPEIATPSASISAESLLGNMGMGMAGINSSGGSLQEGKAMPEHKAGNPAATIGAFRRYAPTV